MEESKRIRIRFRDDDILSETQKSESLERSWLLLKPRHHLTVSDLTAHLLEAFQLYHSCPHGLLLSISRFMLPPFESTCIIKDNEIISVSKRRQILPIEADNASNELKKLKALEKQPVTNGILLLENEEFEKEGGYESENNEEEQLMDIAGPSGVKEERNHRKRKAPEKLQGSRKKKQRSEANNVQTEKAENSLKRSVHTKKNSISSEEEKDDSSDEDDAQSSDKNDVNDKENAKENADTKMTPKEKAPSRSARRKYAKRKFLQEMKKIQMQNVNCESEGLRNWKADQAKKTKVEKGKEKWKKQQPDAEMNDDGQPKGLLHWMRSPQDNRFVKEKKRGRKNQKVYFPKHANEYWDANKQQNQKSDNHEQPNQNSNGIEQPTQNDGDVSQPLSPKNCVADDNQNTVASEKLNEESDEEGEIVPIEESDEEGEIVPIEIRPGHIRFEPLSKESGQAVKEKHAPPEKTFHWNGVTSKKKGQKWGQNNHSFVPQNDAKNSTKVHSEMLVNVKDKVDAGIDLDKLPPLTSTPKEGDVIAYRILELSSTWTPELSALRVGKVSWYDARSNQTLLVPVPGYPIFSKKANEDETEEPHDSLYREDGSLEIDFASLIDARVFDNGRSAATDEPPSTASECNMGNENLSETVLLCSNSQEVIPNLGIVESNQSKETEFPNSDTGGTNIWDQISEALNSKKEQLSKENGWGKTPPKKVQPSQENKWGENARIVKPPPGNNWGKNGKKVNPPEDGSVKQSPGGKPWSYKALRGSALGPTMAMLRSRRDV